jgi:hypothetical protein
MSRQGEQTGEFGRRLSERLGGSESPWIVYYDHGFTEVDGNVVATKGFFGNTVTNLNRLADVDVLLGTTDGAAALIIEIEERACSPKKLIGDVMAALLCNQFAVRVNGRQHSFRVLPTTRLIVAGVMPNQGHRIQKIEQVIVPRLREMHALPGGILPSNVELIFNATMDDTLACLNQRVDVVVNQNFLASGG